MFVDNCHRFLVSFVNRLSLWARQNFPAPLKKNKICPKDKKKIMALCMFENDVSC